MPHRDQCVGGDSETLTYGVVQPSTRARRMEQPRYCGVSPSPADIGQQRLAVSVREEARIIELTIAWKRILRRVRERAAHPHRRQPVDRAEGCVLGHTLDEPQWK